MEIIKTSENYSIKDYTDNWNIIGSVYKESTGVIRINITVSTIETEEYVGNFNYSISANNNVNVNFDCARNSDDALFTYGNLLVDSIIEQIK